MLVTGSYARFEVSTARLWSGPPAVDSESTSVRKKFASKTEGLAPAASDGAAAVAEVLDSVELSQVKKREIMQAYNQATRFLHDGAPFLVSSFQEAPSER